MKISIFQGILFGVFGLAAIIGVFVFATFSGSQDTEDQIGTVLIWGSLPKDQVNAALTAARQTRQDLKSVSYVQKGAGALRTDLISAIAQDQAPDMVLISHEDLFALYKFLQPIPASTLSERTFKDAFVAGSEIFLAPNGSGTYGVPFLIDPVVLFENRGILASSGIATSPATWEAVTGMVPKVTTKTPTGNIDRALIALGTYANVRNARGILSTLFLQAGVPLSSMSQSGLRRADLGLSRTQGAAPGQAVARFYTQFADSAKVSYTWNASLPDSQSQFATGDLALYLGYGSEAGFFKDANPNLDFDVAPVPQLATSGGKTTYGLMYAFAVPRGSANPAGAFSAAAALTAAAPNHAAALEGHMAPAGRSLVASPPSASDVAVAYSSALYAKAWLSPAPSDTDSIFSTMINNVISGRLTLDTALASAESALTSLLQQ